MKFEGGGGKQEFNAGGSKEVDGVKLDPAEQEYLLPHFLMLLVGKPGSGKTAILKQLLENKQMYAGKFDYVFIVSPSYAKMRLRIKKSRLAADYSLDWIYDKIDKINEIQFLKQKQLLADTQAMPEAPGNKQLQSKRQALAQSTLESTKLALRDKIQQLDNSNFVQDIMRSKHQAELDRLNAKQQQRGRGQRQNKQRKAQQLQA